MSINTHSIDFEASSSQCAYKTDTASLSITGDMTIECWFKPESVDINHTLVAKYLPSSNKRSYSFRLNSSNVLDFRVSADGTTPTTAVTTDTLAAGNWYHIAVSYDASEGTCQFYINGSASQAGSSLATSINDNDANFIISGENTGASPTNPVDGLVDEVRVWSDIRSAAEIAANYQKELTGGEANLVGYWKFNNSADDETSNNNDLTLTASPTYSTTVPFVGTDDSGGFIHISV